MPERTFFSLRYGSPGYTFILLVFLVALPSLQKILFQEVPIGNTQFAAAFLAFFALLEGSAMGFLISQIWYLFYNELLHRRFKLRQARDFLQRTYGLDAKDFGLQTIFLDYAMQLSRKNMLTYTQRRWDLLHTIGSTFFAALLGSSLGLLLRTLLPVSGSVVGIPTALYDFLLFMILEFLLFVLVFSLLHVSVEHARMAEIILMEVADSGKLNLSRAKRVFPPEYLAQKAPSSDNPRRHKPICTWQLAVGAALIFLVVSASYCWFVLPQIERACFENHFLGIMNNVNGTNTKTAIADRFERSYNFTELYKWVNERLWFVPSNETFDRNTDPIKILESGKGRCEEFSILYVACCLANGYQSRIIVAIDESNPRILVGLHVWAEVRLDHWVHVDPSDQVWAVPYRYESWSWGKDIGHNVRIYAFQQGRCEEVTSNYKQWRI